LYVYPSYIYGLDIVNLFKKHQEKIVIINLSIGVIINSALSSLFLHLNYGITGVLLGSAIAQLIVMVLFKLVNPLLKRISAHD
jgi:large-conductance mechanosensitive channel